MSFFKYSLEIGVRDGYLVNPRVLDARTEITTELLSKQGYFFEGLDYPQSKHPVQFAIDQTR